MRPRRRQATELLLALMVAGGCGQPNRNALPLPPSQESTEIGFPNGRHPIDTSWEHEIARLSARACSDKPCHAAAHDDWQSGMHGRAWRDPVFKAAFDRDKKRWCAHCHAPLAVQREAAFAAMPSPTQRALLDEGINCVACHVRDGEIYGTRPNADAPHAVLVSERLGTAAFCADCHQFNFPHADAREPIRYTAEPLQNTYAEWLAADARTCNGCHWRGAHQIVGPHDGSWLRATVGDARWRRDGDKLHVSIPINEPLGHRYPSGDAFHAVVLEVARDSTFSRSLASHAWRRTLTKGAVGVRRVLHDTTLPPEATHFETTLSIPAHEPLYGRLRYVYDISTPSPAPSLLLWQGELPAIRSEPTRAQRGTPPHGPAALPAIMPTSQL